MNKTLPTPSRSRPTNLYVENVDVLEDLLSSVSVPSKDRRAYTTPRPRSRQPEDRDDNSLSASAVAERLHREQVKKKQDQDDAQTKRLVLKSLQQKEANRDARFTRLLSDIEEAKSLLQKIDTGLNMDDEAKRNKVRRHFEDWNVNVHGKIQMKIAKQVDQLDSKTLNKQKNDDYNKFLDISNRKACIFRDIIIESEC